MNIFDVLNAIRREGGVDAVALHPQLCADDGDNFLRTLVADGKVDHLFVAACDPRMQQKMFKDAFREAGFDPTHHQGVDIRNMDTDEAVNAIKGLIHQSRA
jgi:heterodisulfide reductase subunit A-like polyferredoxin